ncbi:MAG: HEAT repeat domain-containing protein [Paenibacillaceae bacterium]
MTVPILLTDEQMQTFISHGYLILQTGFPAAFHRSLTEQLHSIYQEEGNPGNNLLPRVRELQKVFDHPIVMGALTSVLGENYMLHAHRHGHYNAIDKPGLWHKDSYWGYNRTRNHHPWWAMIMYFPQDTPKQLGPTGIMPCTQNYETRTFTDENPIDEAQASGEAGTFALIHYDIWHRSTANLLGQPRYMLKFEFMRTQAPASPSWNHRGGGWRTPQLPPSVIPQETMWQETWNWLCGQSGSLVDSAPFEPDGTRLATELQSEWEPDRIHASYELARRGSDGVAELLRALREGGQPVSLAAAYGLSVAGAAALSGLVEALDSSRTETVIHAVFALGEQGRSAAIAVPKLISLTAQEEVSVRRVVVESLGMIGEPSDQVAAALNICLQDDDVQVRFMAGLAIAKIGDTGDACVEQLVFALDDENRYVRAHAAEALRYIGTERAHDVLIKHLFSTRWCATTTPANTAYP